MERALSEERALPGKSNSEAWETWPASGAMKILIEGRTKHVMGEERCPQELCEIWERAFDYADRRTTGYLNEEELQTAMLATGAKGCGTAEGSKANTATNAELLKLIQLGLTLSNERGEI
mgnify:CR=1 FL=1